MRMPMKQIRTFAEMTMPNTMPTLCMAALR